MAHHRRKTKSEHPSGRPDREQAPKQPVYKVQLGSKAAARLPGHGMRTR